MEIYRPKSPFVSSFWRDKYEKDAKRNWDKFYLRNSDRFFKDRHYLDKEWGHYFRLDSSSTKKTMLEAGCGAGNTVFPLLAEYPHLFIYACDFSPRAVQIVKANKEACASRVHAFVCDITSEQLSQEIPLATVDVATMVFMLSAVSPERMPGVLQNTKAVLKPGGVVLLRDYAVGDLAEARLKSKDQQISENFFVRGDGTRAYYFSEDYLTKLFAEEGFVVESMSTVCKVVENRSKGLKMHRRWIQAVFRFGSCRDTQTLCRDEIALEDGIGMEMFVEEPVVEETEVVIRDFRVRGSCISRFHQHTCNETGLMLWESALTLSHLLLELPSLVSNKNIVELGCGCIALGSLFASLSAKRVVATDCDEKALHLLSSNLKSNTESFPVHKISCRKLTWGQENEVDHLLQEEGLTEGGVDLVIGTDVTYVAAALPSLFRTATRLLHQSSSRVQEPAVLLCHMARKVGEVDILDTAQRHGFKLKWKCHTAGDGTLPLMTGRKLPVDSSILILFFSTMSEG